MNQEVYEELYLLFGDAPEGEQRARDRAGLKAFAELLLACNAEDRALTGRLKATRKVIPFPPVPR